MNRILQNKHVGTHLNRDEVVRRLSPMAREYIARDPRTGRALRKSSSKEDSDIRALLPISGTWEVIPRSDILKLASGELEMLDLPRTSGGGFARRRDGIRALNRVFESDIEVAHSILLDCLDDDSESIRATALESMPSFSLRKHEGLIRCLSDRLTDDSDEVREEAMNSLIKMAPVFPSGCEEVLRRELRHKVEKHRKSAFVALKSTSQRWAETGCLHIDELIREEDVDLRRRASSILRVLATKGGAEGWDLIGWCLEDEDAEVRRRASKTLNSLAGAEPRIAAILVEVAMSDDDAAVRKSAIAALKKLNMESPRVSRMVIDGARDRDYELRKACIGLLSIILSGTELRETAKELLRQETRIDLRKRLESLSTDLEMEGSEEQKNSFLAPLEHVPDEEENAPDLKMVGGIMKGEHHKDKLSRPESEGGT